MQASQHTPIIPGPPSQEALDAIEKLKEVDKALELWDTL